MSKELGKERIDFLFGATVCPVQKKALLTSKTICVRTSEAGKDLPFDVIYVAVLNNVLMH